MSMTFTKLFSSITESTVWCEPASTRLVWITMLAMSDRKGRVWASIPGLANRARVSLEDTEVALNTLSSPDKYSRTPDHEGRRIEPIDGGWVLLNHEKYRSIRDEETTREVARNHMRKVRTRDSNATEKAKRAKLIVKLAERDGSKCGICSDSINLLDVHIDHIIPLSCGGETHETNLQLAHPRCNHIKNKGQDGNPLRHPSLPDVRITDEQLSAVIRGSHNADADADTVNKILDASRPAPAKRFIKPTLAEVDAYCLERKNDVHPPKFIDHYESNGWKVGRNPMRDWKAAVRTWEQTGDRHATRQPVDNSAVGKVRAANERARQREAADRQPDAPGVGANGSHVRPPLDQ